MTTQPKQIFIDYLKQRNLKWSRQREYILDLFSSTQRHVTTQELHRLVLKEFPQVGYSTVHRTLKLLAECGLATERHFSDRFTRFENRHNNHQHDHLICTKCGTIIDFEPQKLEKIQHSLVTQQNFNVTHHWLELYGICTTCQKTPKLEE